MIKNIILCKDKYKREFWTLITDKEYFENMEWDDEINCHICGNNTGNKEHCNFFFCKEFNKVICPNCEKPDKNTCLGQINIHKNYYHEHKLIRRINIIK
jgi:hypothetical protein